MRKLNALVTLCVAAPIVLAAACTGSDESRVTYGHSDRIENDSGRQDGAAASGANEDGGGGLVVPKTTFIATGPGAIRGNTAHVRVLDAAGGGIAELRDVFTGGAYGANVATCDVDGDGTSEVVVGGGPDPSGGTPVRILDTNGTPIAEWPNAFEGKHSGTTVACGDVDGDKVLDVVVGLGASVDNDTTVRIFDTKTLAKKGEFRAYEPGVRYGTRVAVADIDGDGKAEIVTAPGPSRSSGAHVKVFSAAGTLVASVHAFGSDARYGDLGVPSGAVVAAGDLDGDGKDEIVIAPGPAPLAAPHVKVYSVSNGEFLPRSAFVSNNPVPHLAYNGYFHVHDPAFGLHIPDVKGFTNWAFIWDTAYLQTAKDAGMKVVYDFQKIIRESPKEAWEANVESIAPTILAFKDTVAVLYLIDEVDIFKMSVADQNALAAMVKKHIPGVPVMMSYFNQGSPPAENLDWIGIDPYINFNVPDEVGCVRRGDFDGFVMGRVSWARAAGKPIVMIPPSFRRTDPTPRYAMPTPCQQRWYLEAAVDEPLMKGLLWFMYGHAKKAERGEEIFGVVDHPDVLAWQKSMFSVMTDGGYGAELAVGDVDGDGKADIVVGHGKGPGNTSMVNVHGADGTKKGSFRAYDNAPWGVSVAVGKRRPE